MLIISGKLGLIFAGLLILAVVLNFFIGVMASTLPAMFPTSIRYSALASAFNVSVLVAGLTPTAVAWLVESTNDLYMPAYYLMVVAVIGLVTGVTMKETANKPLHGAAPAASDIAEARELLQEHHENIEQKIEDIDAQLEELAAKRETLQEQLPVNK
jgi:MHS family proline/betaine transporter-like MFS transporter